MKLSPGRIVNFWWCNADDLPVSRPAVVTSVDAMGANLHVFFQPNDEKGDGSAWTHFRAGVSPYTGSDGDNPGEEPSVIANGARLANTWTWPVKV